MIQDEYSIGTVWIKSRYSVDTGRIRVDTGWIQFGVSMNKVRIQF